MLVQKYTLAATHKTQLVLGSYMAYSSNDPRKLHIKFENEVINVIRLTNIQHKCDRDLYITFVFFTKIRALNL